MPLTPESEHPESVLRGAVPSPARARRIVSGALERSARGERVHWLVPAVAVAAAVLVVSSVVAWRFLGSRVQAGLSTGAVASASEAPVTVRAGDHQVVVEVDSSVRAERVERDVTALEVSRGAARFKVHHLTQGQRFWVTSGGVTVEAVGTQFAVATEGPCVRVEVTEGKVEVRRAERAAERLGAGESHVYCQRPAGPEALTDEERLVFAALDAVRRGGTDDLSRAAATFRDYHRRYPNGAYEEEALYYSARIAHRLGRADEARAWALEFIARFPSSQRAAELSALLSRK